MQIQLGHFAMNGCAPVLALIEKEKAAQKGLLRNAIQWNLDLTKSSI